MEREIPPQYRHRPEVALHRYGSGIRSDGPTVSDGDVEIVLPDDYRLSCEANRTLVHVIMAVRGRMLGSERGIA